MNKFKLILLLLVITCQIAFSQQKGASGVIKEKTKQIEFSADVVRYKSTKQAQMLIGHVVFKHEGVVITCDSAYRFDNNTLEAYDHVFIRKGDSLTISGNQLTYDGNKKLANIQGDDVICTERDMTLRTPLLTYDVANSVGSYFGGGTIVNKENTLTSKNGYYYSATKMVAFKHDVKLKNPDYDMFGDTLMYNTISKTAFFKGPTVVVSKENKLYCEDGWYDTQNEKSHLTTNAHVFTKKNELTADSIYYDRKLGYGKAFSCVQIIDTANKSIIHGQLAEHYENTNISIVTGDAVMIRQFNKDSLFVNADTLYSEQRVAKDSLADDSVFVKAYHHIKIYKKDLQGVADSVTYTSFDSTMVMYHSPVMWSDSAQMNAKEIRVHFANNRINSFELLGNAFIITQQDSIRFNQIKGKSINGFFANDSIRKVVVDGNAQVAYFMKNDKKKLIGFNKTECSFINVLFEKGEVSQLTFINKPVAALIPIKEVDPEKERFKGFSWTPQKKPGDLRYLLK